MVLRKDLSMSKKVQVTKLERRIYEDMIWLHKFARLKINSTELTNELKKRAKKYVKWVRADK